MKKKLAIRLLKCGVNNMIKYLEKISMYLPLSSDDPENIEYLTYLKSAYEENVGNEKYQFALLAFHMMFMSYIYKQFWCLKEYDFTKVKRFCDSNRQLADINNVYDMSILGEKSSIDYTMQSLGFHVNRRSDAQQFVDTRDKCAHASGFIQYSGREVENHFIKVLEYMVQISEKNKSTIESMFEMTLREFWSSDSFNRISSAEKAEKMICQLKLSAIDVSSILQIDRSRILNAYEGNSYTISYIIIMTVLIIKAGSIDGCTSIDLDGGYLEQEMTVFLQTLSTTEFSNVEIELEDEMNLLEQTYGTISFTDLIKKNKELIA